MGILEILDERDEAVREANRRLELACGELRARIPQEVKQFAVKAMDWYHPVGGSERSMFALWIESVVKASRLPSGEVHEEISQRELKSFGFSSFDDCRTKLKALEAAWADTIKIEFHMRAPDRLLVCFSSVELTPPLSLPAKGESLTSVGAK